MIAKLPRLTYEVYFVGEVVLALGKGHEFVLEVWGESRILGEERVIHDCFFNEHDHSLQFSEPRHQLDKWRDYRGIADFLDY